MLVLFFTLTSWNLNPPEQLNQLRLCLLFLPTPQLLWHSGYVIVEQQGHHLCCLSPSFSLGRLHTGPCWALERQHLFSWGCNIKGRWVVTEFSCFHTGVFPAAAAHPYPGSHSCQGQVAQPKTCPAPGGRAGSAFLLLAAARPNHPLLQTSLLPFRCGLFTVFLRSGKEFEGVIDASYRHCQKRLLCINPAFWCYGANLKTALATSL